MGLYKLVNLMPSAAFVGMMWMICYYTFEWNTFRLIFHALHGEKHREMYNRHHKINRVDLLVICVVTVVTLFSNLATAVGAGIGINLIGYAVQSSKSVRLRAKTIVLPSTVDKKYTETDRPGTVDTESSETDRPGKDKEKPPPIEGTAVYEVEGPLFFASVKKFLSLFDLDGDPRDIELHCAKMSVVDYSAVEALVKLADEFQSKGKRLHVRYLRKEHYRQLNKSRDRLDKLASWEVAVELEDEDVSTLKKGREFELMGRRNVGQ